MINKMAAIKAVRRACAFIPMMPQDDVFVAELTEELQLLVNNEEELAWLVNTMRRVMTKWQSIAQLRGLFCTRFAPADGFVNACTVPGYTTEDLEHAFYARQAAENQRRLLAYRAEAQKLLAGEAPPFEFPLFSKMPSVPSTQQSLPELETALASAPRGPRRTEEETERLIAELRLKLTGKATETTAPAHRVSL